MMQSHTRQPTLAIADAVLAFANARPHMPTREELAAVIGAHLSAPVGPTAVAPSPEGEATDEEIKALLQQDFERVDLPDLTAREWEDLRALFGFARLMLRMDKTEWIGALREMGDANSEALLEGWTRWRTRLRGASGMLDAACARYIVAAALAGVPDQAGGFTWRRPGSEVRPWSDDELLTSQ